MSKFDIYPRWMFQSKSWIIESLDDKGSVRESFSMMIKSIVLMPIMDRFDIFLR